MLKAKNIKLKISSNAKTFICDTGFDPLYGARPVQRTIQNLIQNPLAKMIIKGDIKPEDTVTISKDKTGLVFK
jgi:ATP-dependent Clp protease ATP-binding subunit ClpA